MLNSLDWTRLLRSLRRQLEKRGIPLPELADRTQDAAALLFRSLTAKPAQPMALAIWRAAGDAARGRTVHRVTTHRYVDAINPLDARERAKIDCAQRESFDRRAALAQLDLDL